MNHNEHRFDPNSTCVECVKADKILSVAYNAKTIAENLNKINLTLEKIAKSLEKNK